ISISISVSITVREHRRRRNLNTYSVGIRQDDGFKRAHSEAVRTEISLGRLTVNRERDERINDVLEERVLAHERVKQRIERQFEHVSNINHSVVDNQGERTADLRSKIGHQPAECTEQRCQK